MEGGQIAATLSAGHDSKQDKPAGAELRSGGRPGYCLRTGHGLSSTTRFMKYRVQVPLNKPLQFPDRCAFSGVAAPTSRVRLQQASTSSLIPLPGGFLNRYTNTSLPLPASRKVAVLASALGILVWLSLLAGMALCAGFMISGPDQFSARPALFLPAGLMIALGFRVARWWVLRRVRINPAWGGFVEVQFKSEDFARAFADLNRLALLAD